MAANTYAPFGLKAARRLDGAAPNYAVQEMNIAPTNTAIIAYGDLVTQNSSGYIDLYATGGTAAIGAFNGCKYLGTDGSTKRNPQWPGTGANTSAPVTAFINVDKNAIYQVQVQGTAIAQTSIGLNIEIGAGSNGNPTLAGFSQMSVAASTVATTNTLPLRIVGIVKPPAVNAAYLDTSDNNVVEVIVNAFQQFNTTGV